MVELFNHITVKSDAYTKAVKMQKSWSGFHIVENDVFLFDANQSSEIFHYQVDIRNYTFVYKTYAGRFFSLNCKDESVTFKYLTRATLFSFLENNSYLGYDRTQIALSQLNIKNG